MTSNKTSENVDMDVSIEEYSATKTATSVSDSNKKSEMMNTTGTEQQSSIKSDLTGKEMPSDVNNSQYKPMPIKKKHRRGSRRNKRRKYKPYSELTWEEKKAVEERDSRRAVNIRKKYMHEKGRPLAPFNTSQFLMAEHDTEEPDLHISHHHHHEQRTRLSSSADDSDYGESSISNEEHDIEEVRNFLQKDFAETYDRLHSELLHTMNKDQLVNEYMQLENKVESLEKELAVIKPSEMKLDTNGVYPGSVEPSVFTGQMSDVNKDPEDETRRKNLELEVKKLREENMQLHHENSILRPKAETQTDDASI